MVYLGKDAVTEYRTQVGSNVVCYNGGVRWVWPGARHDVNGAGVAPNFYHQNSITGISEGVFLYNLQQKALEYHQSNRKLAQDFDSYFSHCRMAVLSGRNQELKAERSQQPASEDEELKKELRREQVRANDFSRRLTTELAKVTRLEQELTEASQRIKELEAASERNEAAISIDTPSNLRRDNRELKDTLRKRENTIEELNRQLQSYRQRERAANESKLLPLTDQLVARLTICNHALNLYRTPMRRFISGNLIQQFGPDLREQLQASVKYFDPYSDYKPEEPESSIDVGDFENLVRDYEYCFPEKCPEPSDLGQIRRFRNKVVHPPVGGLDFVTIRDGLRTISSVLMCIGENDAANDIIAAYRLVEDDLPTSQPPKPVLSGA